MRLIKHLNDDAVGIGEIERSAAVAVDFKWLDDLDAAAAELPFQLADAVNAVDDEAQVVELLALGRRAVARDGVQGEIVVSRGEIDVLRVGLPDDLHAEAFAIKIL